MQNSGLDESQAGIKIAGRNIDNLRYDETEEELKSLLMKVKEERENAGLKLNIQKSKIMASSPITSWQIDGETVTDLIFLGSKIKSDTVSTVSPSISQEVMGLEDAMILVFFTLSFKPAFLLSSFNLSKTLFSSFSLYDMRVVSSTYLKLFIFLPAILIPACDSSSPAFHMMYSAY